MSTSRITFRHKNQSVSLPVTDLLWLEGAENYTWLHATGNRVFLVSHHLLYYQKLLPDELFYRTHKQHMVALKAIRSVRVDKMGVVIELVNKTTLTLSRLRRKAFLDTIQQTQTPILYG